MKFSDAFTRHKHPELYYEYDNGKTRIIVRQAYSNCWDVIVERKPFSIRVPAVGVSFARAKHKAMQHVPAGGVKAK